MEFVNINKKPRPHLHCGENIQGKMGQVFLVDNLFGELKTQTQKEKARKNLGISEALSSDAKIYWVDILGEPEVESPDINDNSQRIATTEWVLEKIKDLSVAEEYLTISASPSQAFKGTENSVVVKWVTNKKITAQSLNGEELDPEVREYKTTTKDTTTF
jgi:hypothetical protein